MPWSQRGLNKWGRVAGMVKGRLGSRDQYSISHSTILHFWTRDEKPFDTFVE